MWCRWRDILWQRLFSALSPKLWVHCQRGLVPAVVRQPRQEPIQLRPRPGAAQEVEQVDPQEILEVVFDVCPVVLYEEYEG